MSPEEREKAKKRLEQRKARKREVIESNLKYLTSNYPQEYKDELIKLMEYVYDDAYRDGQDWAIQTFELLKRSEGK